MGFEFDILNAIQNLRTPFLDAVMPIITNLGKNGYVWITLTLILLAVPKTRKVGVVMLIALGIDFVICNLIIKPMVARIRPCDVDMTIKLLVTRPLDYSFPSGHSAAAFTAVTTLFLRHENKIGACALVLAVLIAFSRLYLYVHFPTDVLGGLLLGIIFGVTANAIVNYISKKNEKKIA